MVGVPGRSKACATCRRRKKGCDFKRPSCGQCTKAGIICDGYERDRIFVHSKPGTESTLESVRAAADRQLVRRSHVPPRIVLHEPLERSAFEDRTIGFFWEEYLPCGKAVPPTAGRLSTCAWTAPVPDMDLEQTALKFSLLAVSVAAVGRTNGDAGMIEQGSRFYGRALTEMSSALRNPSQAGRDELLAANQLLGTWEMFYGADEKDRFAQASAWSSHVEGATAILRMRTPKMYATGRSHQIFVDARLRAIIAAVVYRKATILNWEEWKTVPWEVEPKTPKDELLDMLCELPSVLEEYDILRTCEEPTRRPRLCRDLLDHCLAVDRDLHQWSVKMETVKNFGVIDLSLTPLEHPDDFALAHLTVLYWTACVVLYPPLHAAHAESDSVATLPERMIPRTYARKILQSTSYFFQPNAGSFAANAISFPLGIALQVLLADGSEEVPENQKLIVELWQHDGFRSTIEKFMKSLQHGASPHARHYQEDTHEARRLRAKAWLGPVP